MIRSVSAAWASSFPRNADESLVMCRPAFEAYEGRWTGNASAAKQPSSLGARAGLLRRYTPRNDEL